MRSWMRASPSSARNASSGLPEPYHKVSILYFLEEKPVEDIAKRLNRPEKTVQTQLYRAKQILREQLGKELDR